MSKVDWFISFTAVNLKKTTAELLPLYGIGNNREGAYVFLNLSSFLLFNY